MTEKTVQLRTDKKIIWIRYSIVQQISRSECDLGQFFIFWSINSIKKGRNISISRIVGVSIYWDFGHFAFLKWKISITYVTEFLFHFRKFIATPVSRTLLTVIMFSLFAFFYLIQFTVSFLEVKGVKVFWVLNTWISVW